MCGGSRENISYISKTAQASTRVPSGTFGNRLANASFVNSERFSDVRWYSGLHVITAFPRLQLSHDCSFPTVTTILAREHGIVFRWGLFTFGGKPHIQTGRAAID